MSKSYKSIPVKYDHPALARLTERAARAAFTSTPAYAVWNPADGPPTTLFPTEEEARRAAASMAGAYHDKPFFVIRFCSLSRVETPAVTVPIPPSEDDLPF